MSDRKFHFTVMKPVSPREMAAHVDCKMRRARARSSPAQMSAMHQAQFTKNARAHVPWSRSGDAVLRDELLNWLRREEKKMRMYDEMGLHAPVDKYACDALVLSMKSGEPLRAPVNVNYLYRACVTRATIVALRHIIADLSASFFFGHDCDAYVLNVGGWFLRDAIARNEWRAAYMLVWCERERMFIPPFDTPLAYAAKLARYALSTRYDADYACDSFTALWSAIADVVRTFPKYSVAEQHVGDVMLKCVVGYGGGGGKCTVSREQVLATNLEHVLTACESRDTRAHAAHVYVCRTVVDASDVAHLNVKLCSAATAPYPPEFAPSRTLNVLYLDIPDYAMTKRDYLTMGATRYAVTAANEPVDTCKNWYAHARVDIGRTLTVGNHAPCVVESCAHVVAMPYVLAYVATRKTCMTAPELYDEIAPLVTIATACIAAVDLAQPITLENKQTALSLLTNADWGERELRRMSNGTLTALEPPDGACERAIMRLQQEETRQFVEDDRKIA